MASMMWSATRYPLIDDETTTELHFLLHEHHFVRIEANVLVLIASQECFHIATVSGFIESVVISAS